MNNQLGDLLIALRGDQTLREISKKTDVSHSYLALLEKGIDPRTKKPIKPSVEILKKLAEVYNYSFEVLMDAAGYLRQGENSNQEIDYNTDELTRKIAGIVRRPGVNLTSTDEENLLNLMKQAVKIIEEGKKDLK